jgi:lipoate-protein ligase A
LATTGSLFDVERFRSEPRRRVLVRVAATPTLVLGSTQQRDRAVLAALRARHVTLARRRGGGGAVYLSPDDPLWLDAWIPRSDPLWRDDVSVAAEWVGHWWRDALVRFGLYGLEVHAGRADPGEWGSLVCFAGRGPGEVFHDGRKVVGLSQWRARQGALFSSCAYRRWDPQPLADLLRVDDEDDTQERLVSALAPVAVGLGELDPPLADLTDLVEALTASFESFGTQGGPGRAPTR